MRWHVDYTKFSVRTEWKELDTHDGIMTILRDRPRVEPFSISYEEHYKTDTVVVVTVWFKYQEK